MAFRTRVAPRTDENGKLRLNWPPICVCCLGPKEKEVFVRRFTVAVRRAGRIERRYEGWSVPYCATCDIHQRYWNYEATSGCLLPAGVVLFLFLFLLGYALDLLPLVVVLLLAWVGGMVLLTRNRRGQATKAVTSKCSSRGEAVQYYGRSGGYEEFSFDNQDYALKLIAANGGNRAPGGDRGLLE